MGLLDGFFWSGVKKYKDFTIHDYSEEGEVVTGVRELLDRPGIRITSLTHTPEFQEEYVKSSEKMLEFMKSRGRHGKTHASEDQIREFEVIIDLLKKEQLKTFSVCHEIDTKYVTKKEKNDIREKWGNIQKEFIKKIIQKTDENKEE